MRVPAIAIATFLFSATALAAEPQPLHVSHQGRLLDQADQPVTGTFQLKFAVYKTLAPPPPGSGQTDEVFWSDTYTVEVTNGVYALVLGDVNAGAQHKALTAELLQGDRFLGVSVNGGGELKPRIRLTSAPHAAVATSLKGGAVDATRIDVSGRAVIDAAGRYVGAADHLDVGKLQGRTAADFADAAHDHDTAYHPRAEADALFATKEALEGIGDQLSGSYYTKTAADAQFVSKADASATYYAKAAADAQFVSKTDAAATYYAKTAADAQFLSKADAASLLAGVPAASLVGRKGSKSGVLRLGQVMTASLGATPAQLFANAWASNDNGGSFQAVPVVVSAGAFGQGDGHDGSLNVTGTKLIDDVRSVLSATAAAGAGSIAVASASGFAAGQLVLVVQAQGPGAGAWELHRVASVSGSNLVFTEPLRAAFASGGGHVSFAQRVPEYSDVNVPSGATITASPWNGQTGGVVAFFATGTVTVGGTITAAGLGYRGGTAQGSNADYVFNQQGEGQGGVGPARTNANGSANGAGGGAGCGQAAGGGGGGSSVGSAGTQNGCWQTCASGTMGVAGQAFGLADTQLLFGGGGGASGSHSGSGRDGANGGAGGGIVLIAARSIAVTGTVTAGGAKGSDGYPAIAAGQPIGGGGGGGGGTVRLEAESVSLGSNQVLATGGAGGGAVSYGTCSPSGAGGTGGGGRIIVQARTTSGTTNPPLAASSAQSVAQGVSISVSGPTLTITSQLPGSPLVRVDYAY